MTKCPGLHPESCACEFSPGNYCACHPKQPGLETAAQELAAAKRAYAESFLLHRINQKTDKQAEMMAEVDCGERLILAQAQYDLAKR